MLIDKLTRLLYREVPGKKDSYYIVYPRVYMEDIYTDFTLTEKTSVSILQISDSIQNIRETIQNGLAPVTSICGRNGAIKLFRTDIVGLKSPNGLTKVDNTSDMEKPPNDLFQRFVNEKVTNELIPSANRLTEESAEFRLHVTGTGGGPIQNNPHKDTFNGNLLYNGSVLHLDPSKFLSTYDLTNQILKHNDDPNSHIPILNLIKSDGTIATKLNQLEREANLVLEDMHSELIDTIVPSAIAAHNTNPASHNFLLKSIQEEKNRLDTLNSTEENPRYEYQRYKVTTYNPNFNYTREYPSLRGTWDALRTIPSSVQFNDPSRFPYIQFVGSNIRIGTSNAVIKNIVVNTISPTELNVGTAMAVRGGVTEPYMVPGDTIDYYKEALVMLPFTHDYCWREKEDIWWQKFKLNYGPLVLPDNMCYVGYTENPPTLQQVRNLNYSMGGLHFSKYGVTVYHAPGKYTPEEYQTLTLTDRAGLQNPLITDQEKTDPNTRVIWVKGPDPYVNDNNWMYPIYMRSFDFNNTPVQPAYIPMCSPTKNTKHQRFKITSTSTQAQRTYHRGELHKCWCAWGISSLVKPVFNSTFIVDMVPLYEGTYQRDTECIVMGNWDRVNMEVVEFGYIWITDQVHDDETES